VAPFSIRVKSPAGYYLVRHGQKRPSPAISAFTRWLNTLFKRVSTELKVGPL
jgi:DNA-binding transcriptional LysR family regulator